MPTSSPRHPQKYKFLEKIGSGAFADVVLAINTETEKRVAIKRLKQTFETVDIVQKIPELKILKLLENKPYAVNLEEVLYDRETGKLALVFELMQNNLYDAFKNSANPMAEKTARFIFFECCCSAYELEALGFMHRDHKPENFLIETVKNEILVKLADFGSVEMYEEGKCFTEYIGTRWYRAPELLLSDGDYDYKADVFALGCILYELLAGMPLFPGKNELDELVKEIQIIGMPSKQILQKMRKNVINNPIKENFQISKGTGIMGKLPDLEIKGTVELVEGMITFDPSERWNLLQALESEYFKGVEEEIEQCKSAFPEENYTYLKNMCDKYVLQLDQALPAENKNPRKKRRSETTAEHPAREAPSLDTLEEVIMKKTYSVVHPTLQIESKAQLPLPTLHKK